MSEYVMVGISQSDVLLKFSFCLFFFLGGGGAVWRFGGLVVLFVGFWCVYGFYVVFLVLQPLWRYLWCLFGLFLECFFLFFSERLL